MKSISQVCKTNQTLDRLEHQQGTQDQVESIELRIQEEGDDVRDGGGSGGGGGGDGVSAVNGGRKKKHQRSRLGSDDFKGEERRRSVEVDKRQGSVESQQSRKSVDREHGRGSTDREYNNSRESLESRDWDSRELATVVAGQEAVLARLEMKLERIIGQVGRNALT